MKKIYSTCDFDFYSPEFSELELSFAGDVNAGFPSPAEDFSREKIDLSLPPNWARVRDSPASRRSRHESAGAAVS